MLNLPQMLILLAIDDDQGRVIPVSSLRYGLKAAVLADLTLLGKIKIGEQKKLWVIDSTQFGDDILENELKILCESGHPRKISSWMFALGHKKLRKQITDSLVQNNILTPDQIGFQWVIPYTANPEQHASAKYWIKKQLRGIVLASETPEPRMVALLSLLRACRLLDLIFTKDERKAASKTIPILVGRCVFDDATVKSLEDIGLAVSEAAFPNGKS